MVRVRVGRDVRGRVVVLDARARHGVEPAAALAREVVDAVELVRVRVRIRFDLTLTLTLTQTLTLTLTLTQTQTLTLTLTQTLPCP